MLIGHQKIWQYLVKSVEQNKLSHALLFSGQEKLGKKTLAIEFAKRLFREDIMKKQHPDFIFVEPRKTGSGKAAVGKQEIQISQIKDCIWRLSLKPSIASFKIAIIDKAHCSNQEAQNALLKTLEEPKGKSLLFLITEHPERLFPTILSRCQVLRFYPVPKEEIADCLKNQKVTGDKIEEILKNSNGQPGLVIDFLSDPQKLKTQRTIISNLIKIMNSDLVFRFQQASELSKEAQDLKDVLNIWQIYFRDILISNINRTVQEKYSLDKLKKILKIIQKTNFLITTTNASPKLALETLMMEL